MLNNNQKSLQKVLPLELSKKVSKTTTAIKFLEKTEIPKSTRPSVKGDSDIFGSKGLIRGLQTPDKPPQEKNLKKKMESLQFSSDIKSSGSNILTSSQISANSNRPQRRMEKLQTVAFWHPVKEAKGQQYQAEETPSDKRKRHSVKFGTMERLLIEIKKDHHDLQQKPKEAGTAGMIPTCSKSKYEILDNESGDIPERTKSVLEFIHELAEGKLTKPSNSIGVGDNEEIIVTTTHSKPMSVRTMGEASPPLASLIRKDRGLQPIQMDRNAPSTLQPNLAKKLRPTAVQTPKSTHSLKLPTVFSISASCSPPNQKAGSASPPISSSAIFTPTITSPSEDHYAKRKVSESLIIEDLESEVLIVNGENFNLNRNKTAAHLPIGLPRRVDAVHEQQLVGSILANEIDDKDDDFIRKLEPNPTDSPNHFVTTSFFSNS